MIKLKTTMKKLITMIIILSAVTGAQAQKSLHDFTVKSINGKDYDLAQLKGKKATGGEHRFKVRINPTVQRT